MEPRGLGNDFKIRRKNFLERSIYCLDAGGIVVYDIFVEMCLVLGDRGGRRRGGAAMTIK